MGISPMNSSTPSTVMVLCRKPETCLEMKESGVLDAYRVLEGSMMNLTPQALTTKLSRSPCRWVVPHGPQSMAM